MMVLLVATWPYALAFAALLISVLLLAGLLAWADIFLTSISEAEDVYAGTRGLLRADRKRHQVAADQQERSRR